VESSAASVSASDSAASEATSWPDTLSCFVADQVEPQVIDTERLFQRYHIDSEIQPLDVSSATQSLPPQGQLIALRRREHAALARVYLTLFVWHRAVCVLLHVVSSDKFGVAGCSSGYLKLPPRSVQYHSHTDASKVYVVVSAALELQASEDASRAATAPPALTRTAGRLAFSPL